MRFTFIDELYATLALPVPGAGEGEDKEEAPPKEEEKEEEGESEEGEEGDDAEGEEKDEKDDDEEDETKDNAVANQLYAALKNPATAAQTLTALAASLGLSVNATKAEKEEAADTLEDELKEIMGKDYEFLAARISKGIKLAVEKTTAKHSKAIKDEMESIKAEAVREKIDDALGKLDAQYEISNKVQRRAAEILKARPLDPSRPYTSIKGALFEASAELDIPLKKKASANGADESAEARRMKNRREAGMPSSSNGQRKDIKTQPKTLDEAIALAVKQVKPVAG
jgi:hypothetical protein